MYFLLGFDFFFFLWFWFFNISVWRGAEFCAAQISYSLLFFRSTGSWIEYLYVRIQINKINKIVNEDRFSSFWNTTILRSNKCPKRPSTSWFVRPNSKLIDSNEMSLHRITYWIMLSMSEAISTLWNYSDQSAGKWGCLQLRQWPRDQSQPTGCRPPLKLRKPDQN